MFVFKNYRSTRKSVFGLVSVCGDKTLKERGWKGLVIKSVCAKGSGQKSHLLRQSPSVLRQQGVRVRLNSHCTLVVRSHLTILGSHILLVRNRNPSGKKMFWPAMLD